MNGPRSYSHGEARPGFETRKPSSRAHALMHTQHCRKAVPHGHLRGRWGQKNGEGTRFPGKKETGFPKPLFQLGLWQPAAKRLPAFSESWLCFRSWEVHPRVALPSAHGPKPRPPRPPRGPPVSSRIRKGGRRGWNLPVTEIRAPAGSWESPAGDTIPDWATRTWLAGDPSVP